jgi:DNA binding domain, excisionase family
MQQTRSRNNRPREDFYTIAEAAALLKVSPSTVWRWIDQGKLSAYRVGDKKIRIEMREVASIVRPFGESARRGGAMNKEAEGSAWISPTKSDQREDQLKVIESARRLQVKILARRKGRLLPESAVDIAAAREERTADL